MDEATAPEDDPALLTLELILLDLTWIRLPKVEQDQLIIPTLCFKLLDFPLVTFSPQQEPTDDKTNLVVYNQGKSCIFRTGLLVLCEQFRTYPIYSFLMDTGQQPAPMVAFGSFPLQAVLDDMACFVKDRSNWPTISAQHGEAYLRNTRGKRVALISFALRLSCLSDGVPVSPVEAVTVPAARPLAERHVQLPGELPGADRCRSEEGAGEHGRVARPARWPRWDHGLSEDDSAKDGHDSRPAENRRSDRHAAGIASSEDVRVVRRTDRRRTGQRAVENESIEDQRITWETEQRQWHHRLSDDAHASGAAQRPRRDHSLLEDVSDDERMLPQRSAQRPRSPRSLPQHDVPSRRPALPPAARSRSSSADRPGPGGSCWRAPLETDEGSVSDASSGPIVSRLIQELAAMQRATADSRHVAVQTRPLTELQPRAPPPRPLVRPVRTRRPGRGRRPPPPGRLALISEEPVAEGFARRRVAGVTRPPPPPPDTTTVDRLSRGQPVSERRAAAPRRAPPPRLRPVTLTRTAQLRLARHMADVRHDLHAQEYGRRRDRWLAEQRRRLSRARPQAAPPPPLPAETAPPGPSRPSGPTRSRRRGKLPAPPPPAAAVKSVGVQSSDAGGAAPAEVRRKAAAAAARKAAVSPPSSFTEPRLAASPPSSLAEPRLAAVERRSSPGDESLRGVKPPRAEATFEELSGGDCDRTSRRGPAPDSAQSDVRRAPSPAAARRSRSETTSRSAAGRAASAAVSPQYSSEPFEPDSAPINSAKSGERRRRSPASSARKASSASSSARLASSGGRGAAGSGSRTAGSSGPAGPSSAGGAAAGGGRSSSDDSASSTLRTDRHVSEELVAAARRSPPRSPPSAASSVQTESAASPAADSERRSSRRVASSPSIPTQSASVPTRSASAAELEERVSSSSSSEDSSDSSSSSTEQTLTETSATQTSSHKLPLGPRPSGRSPDSERPKPVAGAKPKPLPRRPPSWQRADDPPEAAPAKSGPRAAPAATAPSSGRARPPVRSRSTSRDSVEIDARIAMFLKQSGDKQRQQEVERQQQQQRRQEASPPAPVGATWLKASAAPAVSAVSAVGGSSSWLKAWKVDEEGGAAGGRRASRGRHTLAQQRTVVDLNTDSVSSYAPSDLDGGMLSDLSPP